MSDIRIIAVKTQKDLDDFINFPFYLYSKDPLYVSPLIKELKEQFSNRNPFFKHAKVRYFLANKNGKCAGRIVSIVNQQHIRVHNEKAGFFGFFESINGIDVASAL
ncbi:MAG: hypothetical protein HY754_10290, partial [Nitrospirae bacterium]|nr:hypothetical protein [Nitrospirota bacterium]